MSVITAHDRALLDDQAPYARTGRRDTARARWRLRAIQADIAEFGSPEDPDLAQAREELDLLETAAAARP
ncbi:hypothetical protein A6A08_23455 [Nocardiopsis sp. TSRI0078]|uniref:hypothetical protein n=1 Tax=unclassified Nocardiopsis TaxID=2649073 RepID=UPI0009400F44|nr:hypothetical protein [Nocardiopsis sp. TSRI0078]OKI20510.1 hypothetical protein A6A08_23455 [Nocardiopsis sp. TSRI0078]